MNKFDMAEALLNKTKLRRQEIGDDHGDPYEEALLTGVISLDLKIIIKEIFDHLRSALDYCAYEICEISNPGQDISCYKIYFPIAKKTMTRLDFKSLVGKNIPGMLKSRIDLLPTIESFQPFNDLNNGWISDFASLCNASKHQQLSVINCNKVNARFSKNNDGEFIISIKKMMELPFCVHL